MQDLVGQRKFRQVWAGLHREEVELEGHISSLHDHLEVLPWVSEDR